MEGVLKGIRVLDLSSVLAGPLAGTFLAECGADVIKVEPPSGDVTRTWKLPEEAPGASSAYYEAANHGKTVVFHDLKTAEGKAWLQDTLAHTDVLLQNMKWGDLDTMGLMPDQLSDAFPRLVHVRLVGFEQHPERLAYDVVVQAESGFMSMNGTPDGLATKMPVAMMDILASHQMRAAVLGGLFQRERMGRGGYGEVSLWGSGLTALANQGTQWLIQGQVPQRMGSAHPNIAPYGDVLSCRDGEVVLAVGSDAQFTSLCNLLGCDGLANDPRFHTNVQRVKHRDALVTALNASAGLVARADLLAAFVDGRVPAGAVHSVREALESDMAQAYLTGPGERRKVKTSAIHWGQAGMRKA